MEFQALWRVGRAPGRPGARRETAGADSGSDSGSLRNGAGSGRRAEGRGRWLLLSHGRTAFRNYPASLSWDVHMLSRGLASCMGLGHVSLRSAGAPSPLRSCSFGLRDASPSKIWMGSPCRLQDTRPCCTPHCAEAGELGSAAQPRASCEHLLRAPACCRHPAWPSCSRWPRTHPGLPARLQAGRTFHERT